MPLSDFKLPCKGALQDAPPTGDLDFYRQLDIQAQGLLRMYNERVILTPYATIRKYNMLKVYATPGGYVSWAGASGQLFWNASLYLPILTAIPSPGYVFIGWGGDLSGLTNPISPLDIEWASVSANFKKIGDPDPPLITYVPLTNTGNFIDFLRGVIDGLTNNNRWINHLVHPSGNIAGLGSYNSIVQWNTGSIWAAAGVPDFWTKVPSGNPYGQPASTGPFFLGTAGNYKQHMNEMIQVLTLLQYVLFHANPSGFPPDRLTMGNPSGGPGSNALTTRTGSSIGEATCQDGKDAATAAWTADTPIDGGSPQYYANLAGTANFDFSALLESLPGRFFIDLTLLTGSFQLFGYFLSIGSSIPVQGFTGNNTYQLIDSGAAPVNYVSPTLASSVPDFPADCPMVGSDTVGWNVGQVGATVGNIGSVVVFKPTFDLV